MSLSIEEIRNLSNEEKKAHRRKTEVFTRIVGYVRRVEAWNYGKREEFKDRKLFSTDLKNETSKNDNRRIYANDGNGTNNPVLS
jgi:hypothetical protein